MAEDGFAERGIVEIVSTGVPRDAPDAEIRITGRGGRGGEHRWAYERATDGSWSSSESEYGWSDYRYTFVSESVLLG